MVGKRDGKPLWYSVSQRYFAGKRRSRGNQPIFSFFCTCKSKRDIPLENRLPIFKSFFYSLFHNLCLLFMNDEKLTFNFILIVNV